MEQDDLVDAVQELRPEGLLEIVLDQSLELIAIAPLPRLDQRAGQVRGHDDQGVLEIHVPALAIGQPAILQDLQEDVEHIRVGFFDFVEQDDRIRSPAHRLGQMTALFITHVARRCADHPCDGVLFHIFRHVDADHRPLVVEQELRERARQLGLADARRSHAQKRSRRTIGVRQPGAGAPHCLADG